MTNDKKAFTLFECAMVVAILMFVAGVAIRNVARSVRDSEENTIHTAATDYTAVKNMYTAECRPVPVSVSGANSARPTGIFATPAR